MNLYDYVGNNPINIVDPFGLQGLPPRKGTPIPIPPGADLETCTRNAIIDYLDCLGVISDVKKCGITEEDIPPSKEECLARFRSDITNCMNNAPVPIPGGPSIGPIPGPEI